MYKSGLTGRGNSRYGWSMLRSPNARVLLIQFTAPWHSFVGQAFGIAFLNLLTLGLYKPYGLTRLRRALYRQIYIGRDPLRYDGTARDLGRVTFYPALAALFLLLGPGIIQFYVAWPVAVGIGLVQLLVLIYYSKYLAYRNHQYAISQISWQGYPFSLSGAAGPVARRAFGLSLLNVLTVGALGVWQRISLTRLYYCGLHLGRHAITCQLSARSLVRPYYIGWVLVLLGWGLISWYGWHDGVQPVLSLLQGGPANPDMARAVNPALFTNPTLGGAMDSQTAAELGTFMHALILSFWLIPSGLLWQRLCLTAYELAYWRSLADGLRLGGSRLRFDGSWLGLAGLDSATLLLNMFFVNLTRPFTTYARLRYFSRHLVVTGPESLENILKPNVSPAVSDS